MTQAIEIKDHDTIIIGWDEHGKVEYCRTFDSKGDHANMIAAYNYVSEKYPAYVMTSNRDAYISD